jgi:hypothetical protein
MDDNNSGGSADQAGGFEKIWFETITKTMQAAFSVMPNSPPPETFRHIRSGVLQALAQSWDHFLRSPQFLEAMKQWMEQTVTVRKMSNEFLPGKNAARIAGTFTRRH